MANEYFTASDPAVRLTTARAAPLDEWNQATADAFDLLPPPARLQTGAQGYALATGSAGAYAVTLTPWPAAPADGQQITMLANHDGPGAVETLTVNGGTAKPIRNQAGTTLAAGDIVTGTAYRMVYVTNRWQMVGGGGGGGSGDTTYNITEVTASSEVIRPEDFALGSDALNLAAAFAQGVSSGTPVRLDGTYTIAASLSTITMTTGTLTVIGNGKIHITADLNTTPAITIHATYPTATAVSAIAVESHTFPTGDAATTISTKITASGHGLSTNDIFKIVADDVISNSPDVDAFVGQFGHVGDVSGTSFWMGGALYDTYTTTKRVVRVRKETRLIWDGPGFSSVAGNVWDTTFLRVRGFVQPKVRTWVRDGYATGVDVSSCLLAEVNIEILGLKNDVDTLSYGYGVRDTCSAYSQVTVRSLDCRHAYTTSTSAATANGEPYLYGRTLGAVVTGVAMGGSSSPFDTHSEGTDVTFVNCSTGNSYLGSASGGQSITLRGANNRAINCTDRNSVHGFSFIAEGDETTSDCEFIGCRYFGRGSPFRINAADGNGTIVRPRISSGFGQSSSTTMVQAWDCTGGVIDGLRLAPTGASGQAILLSGAAEVTVRNLIIDLRGYTGVNNYRAFAFSAATTGNLLVVESARVINGSGKFQYWFQGSSTSGSSASFLDLRTDDAPTSNFTGQGSLDSFNFSEGGSIYITATEPTGPAINDIWIDIS